jgi:hypothetical protein
VLRDGHAVVMTASEVVPGDVLLLEAGDIVAADAKLLEAHALATNEAALTGESLPVDKATQPSADIHIAAFLTACAGNRLDVSEMIGLTRAMVGVGERLSWGRELVVDKHSVGGLAGTADVVDTFTRASLSLQEMRRVVEKEGGCLAWGGRVGLSPVDDVLVRVERPLDLDSEGQMVASVLSKKAAAGSTHVLIDIPVGPTAKVRSMEAAALLTRDLVEVGRAVGLQVQGMTSDGTARGARHRARAGGTRRARGVAGRGLGPRRSARAGAGRGGRVKPLLYKLGSPAERRRTVGCVKRHRVPKGGTMSILVVAMWACTTAEEQARIRRVWEMQDHEDSYEMARDALGRGDLATAQQAGLELAQNDLLPGLPEQAMLYLQQVRAGGSALSEAQTLEQAATELAAITESCEACHQSQRAGRLPPDEP